MVVMRTLLLCVLPHIASGFMCESSTSSSKEADPMSCRKFKACTNGVTESQECGQLETFDVLYRLCRNTEVVGSCSYAPRDCYIDKGAGFDYQGNISTTLSGTTCQRWSQSQYSFNKHKLTSNFCRNPNPTQYSKPWCPTNDPNKPTEECDIPSCNGASVAFNGRGHVTFNTGTGAANSTLDLEASYEEQILFYVRPTDTDTSSILFYMSSQSDEQTYYVKLYKKVISVFAWLEAGGTLAKANTWIDLADGLSHKIVIKRHTNTIFLQVDDGPEHYSQFSGMTDKFLLPMVVDIGKRFKGCISSLDIITKNAQGKYRHHEPMDVLAGQTTDEQMVIRTEGGFDDGFTSGCMLTPRFSEIIEDPTLPTLPPDSATPPRNNTDTVREAKSNKDLYIILASVIGAALLILLIVLLIVCRSRNKDKGVYKLKETKQFDWEYGNLPPDSKNSLRRESEHGV